MLRTQIQLTEQQSAAIRQVASRQHLSMAEVIRQGIDFFLRSSATASRAERIERALAAAGRFRSGAPDGSSHHDDHLAEAYRA
ncbi:MAG: hypothetical protein A3K19_14370 [Lentisphaerae bacterium RIFOXYB12_FULL_65_16]|nr:MAG: hypothetical protein A3K18_18415 [Lentisphaerae bacterium RIFOXYA12_64_32]OGV87408.1 MAG: hypothetical protein A3K19_14370 [Lentisphaerae bacterium RIFOXYB12_FULL_65_16]